MISVFALNCTYGQNKDFNFEYYNSKFDSIISVYSTDIHMEVKLFDISFNNSNVSDANKKKLIFIIKTMFEQDKYSNLYRVAHALLSKMWYSHFAERSTKIKRQLLELNLQYYFYPDGSDLISRKFSDLSIKNYYTEKSKKRIFEILKDEKTQKEYNAWLLREKSILENENICEILTQWIVNNRKIKNDTIIERVKDSVCTNYILSEAKRMLAEQQIEPKLVLVTGFLGMKECIPTLQNNLQKLIFAEYQPRGMEKAYRFALAKLGDKTQYQYLLDTFISTHSVRDVENYLSYFRDDKITWRFIDVNYSSGEKIRPSSADNEGIPSTIYTMDIICPFIKDLPKELNNPYYLDKNVEMKDFYKWEKPLYEWLMKNRDKIKFDYDINDGWFWSD
jgi:hypothetical protein